MDDDIVKEIHETRQRIYDECGRDVERLIERLKTLDATHKNHLVTFDQVQLRSRKRRLAT